MAEFVDQIEKPAPLARRHERRGADDVGDLGQRLPHLRGRVGEQRAERSEHQHDRLLTYREGARAQFAPSHLAAEQAGMRRSEVAAVAEGEAARALQAVGVLRLLRDGWSG